MSCTRVLFCLSLLMAFCSAQSLFAHEHEALVKKLEEGDEGAEKKLREIGREAIPALREAKPEREAAERRVRNLLTDIAVETSKIDLADATMVHEIARNEGKAKRYVNAERLYKRAYQIYDKLKDDADDRKDKSKSREMKDKREICDRMKDKAGHLVKGETHVGVNLGFVKVGKEHDLSDEWE